MTFLIIEDSPSMAALLVRQMAKGGHRVIVTSTLGDAMDVAALMQPHAMIVDLGLPDSPSAENTVEAIPKLKEKSPESAIVVLTGYLTDAIKQRAYELGAHAVQKKDDSFKDGLELVKLAINKKNCTMSDILTCGSMLLGESI